VSEHRLWAGKLVHPGIVLDAEEISELLEKELGFHLFRGAEREEREAGTEERKGEAVGVNLAEKASGLATFRRQGKASSSAW